MEVSAQQVLLSLFNAQDTVCLRVFADRKDDIFKGQKLSVECGKFTSMEDTLKQHNALHRGIFYVVNYGGHDDDSITRINAQFVEMDSGTFEEQQAKIDAFPLARGIEKYQVTALEIAFGNSPAFFGSDS